MWKKASRAFHGEASEENEKQLSKVAMGLSSFSFWRRNGRGRGPERLALSNHLVGWMFGPLQDNCMISKLLGLAPSKILAPIIGYNCYLHLFGKTKPSSGLEILELDLKTLIVQAHPK